MIDIKKLSAGMVVFSIERRRMGNTRMTCEAIFEVRIVEVDVETGRVTYSWNGNAPRVRFARAGKLPWRKDRPVKKAGQRGEETL